MTEHDRDDPAVAALVAAHGLEPHPEGGWFRRVWTADVVVDPTTDRRAASAILFLLAPGQISRWHRVVDADEAWELLVGGPLVLEVTAEGGPAASRELTAIDADATVPAGRWQRARAGAEPALCRCTVTPEFRFDAFELAPEGWEPSTG